MTHKSLYRRFRPQRFDEVVGQDNTIATLVNQIEGDSIAHAYLFTGSRGTGKTSTAKILARAVNCLSPDGANPCNSCENCRSILDDANIDVIEMDAASNNGVDDIRELREIVKFAPGACKYKVMIIDEVHMLSKGAFNALLKTLEEPPEYMLFILATTEPHKVPATISSRCQHFAFKHIDDAVMLANLQEKCSELGVQADAAALDLIVSLAGGALRDAQSLLDQCIAYSGLTLTYQTVSQALGRTADDAVQQLASQMLAADDLAIVESLDKHYRAGKDIAILMDELINLFRCGMIAAMSGDVAAATALPAWQKWLEETVQTVDKKTWKNHLNHLLAVAQNIKYASHPWLALEIELISVREKSALDDGAALQRLAELEAAVEALSQKLAQLKGAPAAPNDSLRSGAKAEPIAVEDAAARREASNQPVVEQPKAQVTENGDAVLEQVQQAAPAIDEVPHVAADDLTLELLTANWQGDKLILKMDDSVKVLRRTLAQKNHIANIKAALKEVFNSEIDVHIADDDAEKKVQAVRDFFKELTDEDNIIVQP